MDALAQYRRPAVEAAQYHDNRRRGYFAVGWSTATGRQKARNACQQRDAGEYYDPPLLGAGYAQRSFPLSSLHAVLSNLPGHLPIASDDPGTDIWLSQAEFSQPNRQKIKPRQ